MGVPTANVRQRVVARERRAWLALVLLTFTVTALGGCAGQLVQRAAPERFAAAIAELPLDGRAVLVGAGDIARCDALEPAEATAELVDAVIDAAPHAMVFTTGDHAYEAGTAYEFDRCYEPAWGRFNERTAPTPGNHDYRSEQAVPYYDYFSYYRRNASARRRGYYSFALDDWLVLSLNSNIATDVESPQVRWLADELEANHRPCILAYWHHPRFSSSFHGIFWRDRGRDTGAFWQLLEAFEADLIVNGHAHMYERFAQQTHDGRPSAAGVRQVVVGTGGAEHDRILLRRPNSVYVNNDVHGVLVLMLDEESYEWAFVGTDGTIHDRSVAPVPCRGS